MHDREKAIKTLESILDADIYDYWLSDEERKSVCDAIELLKEQQETELCDRCGRVRMKSKWEGR